jgi:hypothetical protein
MEYLVFAAKVSKIWNAITFAAGVDIGLELTAEDVKILMAELQRLDGVIDDVRSMLPPPQSPFDGGLVKK